MKPLSEPEQKLWRRLSLFAGSFSGEAIEAVCLGGDIPREAMADILDQLTAQGVLATEVDDHSAEG